MIATRRGILGAALALVPASRGGRMTMPRRRAFQPGPVGPVLGIADSAAPERINPYLPGTGWDVIFTPDLWPSRETTLEIYHISLDGPVGSSAEWFRNGKSVGFMLGWTQEWQGSFPVGQTDTIAFCWNVARTAGPYNKTSNVQPTVTLWVRVPELEQVFS